MSKIFLYVEACRLRQLDAKKVHQYFILNGHSIVDHPKEADYIFFFTCGYANNVTKYCLNKVKKFQNYPATLVVMGCLPDIDKEELSRIFHGTTLTTKELHKIDELFPENKIKFCSLDDTNLAYHSIDESTVLGALKNFFKNVQWTVRGYFTIKNYILRHFFGDYYYKILENDLVYRVRISHGCLGNCSYCGIKNAVGKLQSKPLDQCVKEFKQGLNTGFQDFILVGDDTGAYGVDTNSSLPQLLDEITMIPGKYSISLEGIHPVWIVRYGGLLEQILKRQKITNMTICIQSGSSRILQLMNRYSDAEKMKQEIIRLRKIFQEMTINTHFIVGFPSETMNDLEKTLSFITNVNFDSGVILPFSCKAGSGAVHIEPKISQKEIFRRLRYAKKFLRNAGYKVIYFPKPSERKLFFQKGY